MPATHLKDEMRLCLRPYLSEISRGRTVLISTVEGGVDVEDASKTISGEAWWMDLAGC